MSFVTWDYRCQNCGRVEERTVRRSEQDNVTCTCSTAPPPLMKRLPAGPATTFRFAGGYIAPKRSKTDGR